MELATLSSALSPLALLACPVGMGAMMWFMMRSGKSVKESPLPPREHPPGQPASIEVLREEQARLSAEIDRLEAGHPAEVARTPDQVS